MHFFRPAPRHARTPLVAAMLAGSALLAQAANFEVAQVVPLTGPLANVGQEVNAITRATLEDFNKESRGTQFVLKTYDDGNVAERSQQLATQATATAQVLLSCFGSVGCMAQQKASVASGVPLLGPIAGAAPLRGRQAATTYAVRASAAHEVSRLLEFAATSSLTKVGVLIQDDGFGRSYAAELDKLAPGQKQLQITRATLTPGTPDYARAVAELRAAQPNVLILLADAAHSPAFLNAWKSQATLPFVLNLAGQANARFAGAMKGYVGTVAFVTVTPSPWGHKEKVQRDYQRVAKTAGLEPSYLGFEAYLNARTLIEGVTQGKAGNRAELARWLDGSSNAELGGYALSYAGERLGSTFSDLALLRADGSYRH